MNSGSTTDKGQQLRWQRLQKFQSDGDWPRPPNLAEHPSLPDAKGDFFAFLDIWKAYYFQSVPAEVTHFDRVSVIALYDGGRKVGCAPLLAVFHDRIGLPFWQPILSGQS